MRISHTGVIALKTHRLSTEVWLPQPLEKVFAFFSDVRNLDRITPPWLHFEIVPPVPTDVTTGTLIEYRLRYRGVPIRWRTEITDWDPPHSFTDSQVRGPYRRWVHRHVFEERDGGTRMSDEVEYAVPGWLLEPLIHRLVVGPDVRAIFEYRQLVLLSLFGGSAKLGGD